MAGLKLSTMCAALGVLATGLYPHGAAAQQYPTRSIRMLVGFSAGGATDIAARVLAQKLSETIGQQVIVDNRTGAASMLAAELVARGAPDGYTVLFANATISMPSLFNKLAFDMLKDLRPVTLAGYGPLALTVHPSLPAKTVKELVALAKRRPGELNYATSGAGSFIHLATELFVNMAAVSMVHVPYKGGAPAVVATMSGESHLTFASVGASAPPVRQGKLRALAVSGLKRNIALPETPTVSEAGLSGYDATSWYGMLAQSNTPQAIVTRLSESAVKALADPQLKERMLAQGIDPATGGSAEFTPYYNAEVVKWAKVIKAAAIPPQ